MGKLFVIGNGFDAYMHKLPTRYSDFREYVLKNYMVSDNYVPLPGATSMPDGGEEYDISETSAYICQTIDSCGGTDWNDLESYLGDGIFAVFEDEFEEIDFDDKHFMHSVYNNEDRAQQIRNVFIGIKDRFCEWINKVIIHVPEQCEKNEEYETLLNSGEMFLTFNYSTVLEDVYTINKDNICHIHGICGGSDEDIFFGHGDFSDYDNPVHIEVEDTIGALKEELRKDVDKALALNQAFFEKMDDISEIYSAGFSFSEVDRPYIERIYDKTKHNMPTWYFTKYDWEHNTKAVEYVKGLGFKVNVCDSW